MASPNHLNDDHDIDVALDLDETIELPQSHADHLYRFVQEASNNAVIHGGAESVSVSLKRTDEKKIQLTIKDDGCGFDTEKKRDRHSLGLSSIRERTAMMDGIVEIMSSPNEGTKIKVMV